VALEIRGGGVNLVVISFSPEYILHSHEKTSGRYHGGRWINALYFWQKPYPDK
jgi:hypothetical protein